MSDSDEQLPPIEDLETLRTQLAEAHKHDLSTATVGGFVLMMLFALPIGITWGTDAGPFGGVLAGLGWMLLLAIGLFAVDAMVGNSKSVGAALRTVVVGGLLAAAAWFLAYGEDSMLLVAVLSVVGPIGGLWGLRSEVRKRARMTVDPPLGLSAETIAACVALPESLAEPVKAILDGAVSDVQAIDRLIDNGMLEASGQSVVALQGDVDRAMRTLARRALVADTMVRREDRSDAGPVLQGMRRIAEELHKLTDAALVAAASAEGTAASLGDHIESLRMTTAGQAEIREAIGES